MLKYGTRDHRGGLDESLKTSVYFDEVTFNNLKYDYEYYGVDTRCHQILFILRVNDYIKPTWLFIQYEGDEYGQSR